MVKKLVLLSAVAASALVAATASFAGNDRSQQARESAACVQAGISTLVSLGLIDEAAKGTLNYYPLGSQDGGAGLINIAFKTNPTYIPLNQVVALHRSDPSLFDWCA